MLIQSGKIGVFFSIGNGGGVGRRGDRSGFEVILWLLFVVRLLSLLVVLRVVGWERGRELVMNSSHGVSVGHYASPMSGRVETACHDAGDDQNAEDNREGDEEWQIGGLSCAWLCG